MHAETTNAKAEAIDRLTEIQEEIEDLVLEARTCIRRVGISSDSADRTWISHILTALGTQSDGARGDSMVTMQDAIEDMGLQDERDEDLEWPDDEEGLQ